MRNLRVAGAALNQTPLAWDENLQNILQAIEQARTSQVSVLCLPEMCISGYGCEDAFFAPNTHSRSLESLLQIVPHTGNMLVAVGLPIRHNGFLYNCSCLIADKKIAGFVAKQFLCSSGIHYESRWFEPWQHGKVSEIKIDQQRYPFGDICFKSADITVGIEICEDAWVENRPAKRLAESGVDLILNLSASHFEFAKFPIRKDIVTQSSSKFNCAYIYSNLLGNESGRAIYDGGTLIANEGQLLVSGKRLSFEDVVLTVADLKIESVNSASSETVKTVDLNFEIPSDLASNNLAENVADLWESSADKKAEEFTRAVSLALFDYLRKSRSAGFVLSLSGGADSAAIACLVRFSFTLALAEIGAEKLHEKLPSLKEHRDLDSIVRAALLTVYQASANSGEVTRQAAQQLAKAVNAEHHEISVAEIVDSYQKLIENSLGRKLDWQTDDLTLQNIQARARGPSVWMYANIRNALLLATSNRSEVAVGYATMDGDTCGSISPIAGVDKAFIRKWLIWVEKLGPIGIGPIAALKYVNDQQPTAELRPGAKQTDEEDLMPYDLLEVIERAAIRDKMGPKEILTLVKTQFSQYDSQQHLRWVKLFFTLWSRSQWKRERYAPSFHLDDESLDPKTWCRYPILSGCFKKELSELK